MIENFDKLDFHRKIDVLVAFHVFGITDITIEWHEFKNLGEKEGYWSVYHWVPLLGGIGKISTNVPLYSTLLTSAWDLVRKFNFFYLFKAEFLNEGKWECKLFNLKDEVVVDAHKYYVLADTEMLAICYAGLKAVGYPLEDFLEREGK